MGMFRPFPNKKQIEAIMTRKFICPECGAELEFEDNRGEILSCDKCGYHVELGLYGVDKKEKSEDVYPTVKELLSRK